MKIIFPTLGVASFGKIVCSRRMFAKTVFRTLGVISFGKSNVRDRGESHLISNLETMYDDKQQGRKIERFSPVIIRTHFKGVYIKCGFEDHLCTVCLLVAQATRNNSPERKREDEC